MISDPVLWRRISGHRFDDEDEDLTFSARLARDNAWSIDYALRAIGEYRRFIYLSAVSQTEVTPSDQVDQVWHLHLTNTRDYWETFSRTIGKQVHHNPTSGGDAEQRRYLDNYRSTLSLYRLEFDEIPPGDIWPDEDARFDASQNYKRIDVSSHVVLHKPATYYLTVPAIVVGALAGAHYSLPEGLATAGIGAERMNGFISFVNDKFYYILGGAAVLGFLIYRFLLPDWYRKDLKNRGGGSNGGGCGSGCGGD